MSLAYLLTGYGILIILVSWVVGAFFLWLGAKIAGIKPASFVKALIATLFGFVAGIVLGLIPVLGWLLGIIAYIIIIKYVFATDRGKAIIAWLVSIIAVIIVSIILGMALGFSFLAISKTHALLFFPVV